MSAGWISKIVSTILTGPGLVRACNSTNRMLLDDRSGHSPLTTLWLLSAIVAVEPHDWAPNRGGGSEAGGERDDLLGVGQRPQDGIASGVDGEEVGVMCPSNRDGRV
jgi:hypothetical protein